MLDYNILRQDRNTLIKALSKKGIGVVAGAALAESLFSNRILKIKSFKDIWYLARALKNFRHHLIKGFDYRFINKYYGISGSQIALSYVLQNSHVSSAVFGTTSLIHLAENLESSNLVITSEIYKKICSLAT